MAAYFHASDSGSTRNTSPQVAKLLVCFSSEFFKLKRHVACHLDRLTQLDIPSVSSHEKLAVKLSRILENCKTFTQLGVLDMM